MTPDFQSIMAMRFKLIIWIAISNILMATTYIHHVDVNSTNDPDLISNIKQTFKHKVVNDRQINLFIKTMKQKGQYKQITYAIDTQNNISTLRFNIVKTPQIKTIEFKNLPIKTSTSFRVTSPNWASI